MTPAIFIVRADVLPISRKTARFRAKAQSAFKSSSAGEKLTFPCRRSGMTCLDSICTQGINRHTKHAGEI